MAEWLDRFFTRLMLALDNARGAFSVAWHAFSEMEEEDTVWFPNIYVVGTESEITAERARILRGWES